MEVIVCLILGLLFIGFTFGIGLFWVWLNYRVTEPETPFKEILPEYLVDGFNGDLPGVLEVFILGFFTHFVLALISFIGWIVKAIIF